MEKPKISSCNSFDQRFYWRHLRQINYKQSLEQPDKIMAKKWKHHTSKSQHSLKVITSFPFFLLLSLQIIKQKFLFFQTPILFFNVPCWWNIFCESLGNLVNLENNITKKFLGIYKIRLRTNSAKTDCQKIRTSRVSQDYWLSWKKRVSAFLTHKN